MVHGSFAQVLSTNSMGNDLKGYIGKILDLTLAA